ncbi:ABC transporter ATP-binding protein [Ottowia sp. VDI28]|uniref:ABC transporter ATP-binding protein n=1 Tax=Ottowia sp. VDI28 TaxID=3133968 RepID=UPI003C2AF0FD
MSAINKGAELLQVRGLGRRFGGLQAVDDLDLTVHAGEIVGVIGPNGAGKSTTFNLIAGALGPSSGTLAFAGTRMNGLPPHRVARLGIARTFQHNRPFAGMTMAENVMVGMHLRMKNALWRQVFLVDESARAEAEAASHAGELLEFVGLGDAKNADVSTLSFGQGRLLEIARCLAARPRLVLLDEPAAGLTPAECDRLCEIIRGIAAKGIAVLLIEHDMRLVMSTVERIVVLNFGRKIAEGTPEQIRSDAAVAAAYLGDLGGLTRA